MVWCYRSNSHNQWKTMLKICFPVMICSPFSIVCPPAPWHLFWTPLTTMWNNIMRIVLLLLRTVLVLFILCSYHRPLLLCQRELEIQFVGSKSYGWIKENNNHHSQLFLLVHYLYYIHFNQNPPPHVKSLKHYYNMQCWLLHSQSTLSVGGWWCFFCSPSG